jgi:uncharacterized membrane protein
VLASWGRRLSLLSREFWFYPALLTPLAILLAQGLLSLDRGVQLPAPLGAVVYDGGVDGARGVLTAIATSTIGVAGTVFSITVAALSYTATSMGPRLLSNFTRDRGNQLTLATFLATFAFALFSLRAVGVGRTADGSGFVPHLNVTVAILLALGCVAMLVYFISHLSKSINTTHVIGLLRDDLEQALRSQLRQARQDDEGAASAPPDTFWDGGESVRADRGGYLQHLDVHGLLARARQADCAVYVAVRPGDYVFPGALVAVGVPRLPDGVLEALSIGRQRLGGQDVEFTANQMAEAAVRALSPGVNDPFTAIEVLDRFGDVLCELAGRPWQSGVYYDDTRPRLVHRITTYDGLLDAMFTMIRQNAVGSLAVLIRMLEVLTAVVALTGQEDRREALTRHADLVLGAGLSAAGTEEDTAALRERLAGFRAARRAAPIMDPTTLPGLLGSRSEPR